MFVDEDSVDSRSDVDDLRTCDCLYGESRPVRYEGDITTVDIDISRCYITHESWLHCSGGFFDNFAAEIQNHFQYCVWGAQCCSRGHDHGTIFCKYSFYCVDCFGFIVFNALRCISFSVSATVYSGFINDSQSDNLDFNDSNHSTTVFNQSRVLLSFAASLASS